MNVCVPRNQVEEERWQSPDRDSKMDKFRNAVRDFMLADNNPRAEYVIRGDAFEKFDPSDGNVRGLIDLISAGDPCPASYDSYKLGN